MDFEMVILFAFVEIVMDESTSVELKELRVDALTKVQRSLNHYHHLGYGTPLYWLHPFTDGQYNGCYFVLVQEGVLVLSYDEIDGCDHEVFIRESARLCDAEEMRCFLTEWNVRSTVLTGTISSLLNFLERKEAGSRGE